MSTDSAVPALQVTGLRTLMADVAERGTTVVLSLHVVADIDGVCDHVVVMAGGRVRLVGEVEPMLAAHLVAVGSGDGIGALAGAEIIDVRTAGRDATALVRSAEPVTTGGLTWHRPTLEELLLGYLRSAGPRPQRKVPA